MAEEVEKLAGDLDSLNKTLGISTIEFKGITKSIIQAADSTSQAGKAWTTFSRLVSGSGIWRLQNKFRAIIEVIGGFERRSKENNKAQQEANKRVIDQVKTYSTLQESVKDMAKFKKLLTKKTEDLTKTEIEWAKENSEGVVKAIKNTYAYNKAVLEGSSPKSKKAIRAGIKELEEKAKGQKELFKAAQKTAKLENKMRTVKGREKVRKQLRQAVRSEQDKSIEGGVSFVKGIKPFFKDTGKLIKGIGTTGKSEGFLKKYLKKYTKYEEWKKKWRAWRKLRLKKKGHLLLKVQIAFLLLAKKVNPIFTLLRKYLMFTLYFFTGLLLLALIVKNAFGTFDEMFGVFGTFAEQAQAFIGAIMTTISSFFGMIGAFISGDYTSAFDYLGELLFSLAEVLWRGALIALQFLLALGVSVFFTGIHLIWTFLSDEKLRTKLLSGLMYLGLTLLGLWVAKFLLMQGLLLIAAYAGPAAIFLGAAGLITGAAFYIVKGIRDSILGFASGGVTKGGMTLVGERGPELVNLPRGSRVHSNSESKKMMGGNNINVTINANSLNDNELRRVAQKVGEMINRQVNRSTSSSTIR